MEVGDRKDHEGPWDGATTALRAEIAKLTEGLHTRDALIMEQKGAIDHWQYIANTISSNSSASIAKLEREVSTNYVTQDILEAALTRAADAVHAIDAITKQRDEARAQVSLACKGHRETKAVLSAARLDAERLRTVLRKIRPWFAMRERWCVKLIDAALSDAPPAGTACTNESGCVDEREGKRTAPCAYSCNREVAPPASKAKP